MRNCSGITNFFFLFCIGEFMYQLLLEYLPLYTIEENCSYFFVSGVGFAGSLTKIGQLKLTHYVEIKLSQSEDNCWHCRVGSVLGRFELNQFILPEIMILSYFIDFYSNSFSILIKICLICNKINFA
jgi:hypothetical protein